MKNKISVRLLGFISAFVMLLSATLVMPVGRASALDNIQNIYLDTETLTLSWSAYDGAYLYHIECTTETGGASKNLTAGYLSIDLNELLPEDNEPCVVTLVVWDRSRDEISEPYVIEFPLPEPVEGDANGDGVSDVTDILLMQQSIAGWELNINTANLDLDHDNELTIIDVMLAQQRIAGWFDN